MAFRRGSSSSLSSRNTNARNSGYRASVIALLLVSILAPLVILASRTTNFLGTGLNYDESSDPSRIEEGKRRSALEAIEAFFFLKRFLILSLQVQKKLDL